MPFAAHRAYRAPGFPVASWHRAHLLHARYYCVGNLDVKVEGEACEVQREATGRSAGSQLLRRGSRAGPRLIASRLLRKVQMEDLGGLELIQIQQHTFQILRSVRATRSARFQHARNLRRPAREHLRARVLASNVCRQPSVERQGAEGG